jgi:pyridoxine 4-dehydrogenase
MSGSAVADLRPQAVIRPEELNRVPSQILDDAQIGTLSIGGEPSVRRLGFGAMRISGARNAEGIRDRNEARALVRRVVDRGVQLIDTANIYGYGESEEIIAEALHPYPDDVMIASKAGYRPGKILPGHNTLPPLGNPDHLREECEKSLRRLRVDTIDLYQVHVPDPAFPWADTVGTFVDLQKEGKVRHIGVSNVRLDQLELAQSLCPIVSVQNRYNAGDRESQAILEVCEAQGIAFLPWAPILTANSRVESVLDEIAKAHQATTQQVSLQWLLKRSPVMLPIPGTSSLAHADQNIDGAWLDLKTEEFARIDAAGG